MNYAATIDYLFTHLPMYQRVGAAAYKKDLTNTLKLLEVIGNPHKNISCIHVAGTNGKGSVSNMLASILQEAGYSTGLYTSPHLEDFRERIRVNGHLCEEDFVVSFTENIKPHIATIQPSFFEITVAMAFAYFAHKEVDIAVIEVGLGGRLDSTNVITPVVSVITNISFDHMHMLGNTLTAIATEKAGIIKLHVPVVIGEMVAETQAVFEQMADAQQATLFPAEENVSVEILANSVSHLELHVTYMGQLAYPALVCGLTGAYQVKNVRTVIQAVEVMRLQGIELQEEAIYEGIRNVQQNTGFAGRWQILQQEPLVVADCAHNAAGLALLFEQVAQVTYNRLHIVTGAVNDKDIDAAIALLPETARYYFCRPDIPRGLEAQAFQAKAAGMNRIGEAYPNVADALTNAIRNAQQNDLVLICGSIFVVAEALPAYRALSGKPKN